MGVIYLVIPAGFVLVAVETPAADSRDAALLTLRITPMLMILALFVIMLGLVVLHVPLVYSLGVASTVILLAQGQSAALLPSRMFAGVDSFVLVAIPFFLLAAELLSAGGLIHRIIDVSRLMIGHLRGGLAQVNILSSMVFSGIQASCTADSAAIGGVMIPAMSKEGYDEDISVVVTATSSCCGPIIPPSILMILYAFLTQTSVSKLFLGGALPGILLGLSLMGVTHYWVLKRGYRASRERPAALGEIARASWSATPALLIPAVIVIGLVGGIVTPTEAGILACVAALLLSGLIYRELSFHRCDRVYPESGIHDRDDLGRDRGLEGVQRNPCP